MDEIAALTPTFAGVSYARLEELGFALTEGAIERLDEIRGVEAKIGADSATVDIALSGARLQTWLARKRSMAGRTGCGLCGVEESFRCERVEIAAHDIVGLLLVFKRRLWSLEDSL